MTSEQGRLRGAVLQGDDVRELSFYLVMENDRINPRHHHRAQLSLLKVSQGGSPGVGETE